MIEHYITLHYAPTEEAKKLYEEMLADKKQNLRLMNWGNLKDDPYADHITFENDALPDGRASDNIADRNPNWCEMTTIYWAWKNGDIKDDDYVQHSHYRKVLEMPDDVSLCETADLIVAQPYPMIFNIGGVLRQLDIEQGTKLCHPLPSWIVMEDALTKGNGWKGDILWDEWRKSPAMFAPQNVWRMRGRLFKEYCEWAFPLAFEMEERLKKYLERENWAKEYATAYQRRWMSFIGERMMSWWCFCQHLGGVKTACAPVRIYENFKPMTDIEEREGK